MDICIRRQLSHSAALLGIAIVGQRILFQIVRDIIPVAVGGPYGVDIGVAVCVGVLAGVFGVLSRNAVARRCQHGDRRHNAVRQSVILRLGFDHFVQDWLGAPTNKDIGAVGKGVGSHPAAGSRCRFIMAQALAGNRTVGGELRRCSCHMVVRADNVRMVAVVTVVTDMDGIIVVIRFAVAVSVHRVDGIEGNITGWHCVFIRRDDLGDVLLCRVFRKRLLDLRFTPAGKNRLFALFQFLRVGIIRSDLLALDMRGGLRSVCSAAAVKVIGERIELFYFRCKGYIAGNCYFLELVGGVCVGSVRPVAGEAIACIGVDVRDSIKLLAVPHLGCSSALPIWHAERHRMGLLEANHQILRILDVIRIFIHIQNNAGRGGVLSRIRRELSSAFRQGEFQRIIAVGVGAARIGDGYMVGVRPAAGEFKCSICGGCLMRSIPLRTVCIAVAVVRFYRNTVGVERIRAFVIYAVKVFIDKNLTANDARLELYLNAGQRIVTLIQRIAHGIGGHTTGSEVDLTTHKVRVPIKRRLQSHINFQFGILRD